MNLATSFRRRFAKSYPADAQKPRLFADRVLGAVGGTGGRDDAHNIGEHLQFGRSWPIARHLRNCAVVVGARAAALVCFLLLTLGTPALAQLDAPLDESVQAYEVQPMASFAGPGTFRRTLPRAAELTLDIVAGPRDSSPKEDEMQGPVAVVTDSQNRLLVADPGSMAVHIFDFARRQYFDVNVAHSGMRSIAAIAVDDKDRIYLSDSRQGKIFIFSSKGKFFGYLQNRKGQESYYMAPVGIAIDPASGYIYVCDRDRNMVIKVSRSGQVLRYFGTRGGGSGPGDFRRPTQIAIAEGELFVLDSGNRRIQKLNLEGKFLAEMRISEGAGLAVDRWKRILISEPTIHRVAVYSNDGHLVTTFGSGDNPQDASLDPSGLWLQSDHCLYVADKANGRVELFRVDGSSGKSCYR